MSEPNTKFLAFAAVESTVLVGLAYLAFVEELLDTTELVVALVAVSVLTAPIYLVLLRE